MNDETDQDVVPFENTTALDIPFSSQAAAAMQSREIAETQALIMAAQRAPRDEGAAMRLIKIECQNMELASDFEYVYTRGGTLIQGPSINLARVIASHWGRMDYGYRITQETETMVEGFAYALDMQNMNRTQIPFTVKKWRETKKGGYPVTSPRDVYEIVASQAMRRVRGCLLALISKTAVDKAIQWCNKTVMNNIGTREEATAAIIAEFETLEVAEQDLTDRIGKKIRSAKLSELIRLHKVYTAIVDGMTTVADEFPERTPAAPTRTRRRVPPPPPSQEDAPREDPVPVDRKAYPAVPADAQRLPNWPTGLHYNRERRSWYDATGTIFDRALHGWNNQGKHPALKASGEFRMRRGLDKETEASKEEDAKTPTSFDGAETSPAAGDNPGWQPGQQNDYADASGR